MVVSGDWLTPYYNYELRFQKPILFYWFVSMAYKAAGVGEAAARFPAALAGFGLAILTYLAGRRWFDAGTGFFAASVVATSFGYFSIGRLSLPDLPLAFFIAAATWGLVEGIGSPLATATTSVSRRRLVARVCRRHDGARAARQGSGGRGPAGAGRDCRVVEGTPQRRHRGRGPPARRDGRPARRRPGRAGRRAMVRGDGPASRPRVRPPLLHRREPRALRHRSLQRAASALVLRADRARRADAVVAVHPAVAADMAAGVPGRTHGHACRVARDHLGGRPLRVLLGLDRQAAAVHPADAAADGAAARADGDRAAARRAAGNLASDRTADRAGVVRHPLRRAPDDARAAAAPCPPAALRAHALARPGVHGHHHRRRPLGAGRKLEPAPLGAARHDGDGVDRDAACRCSTRWRRRPTSSPSR